MLIVLYDIYHILFIEFFVDGMNVCCFTLWLLLRKLSIEVFVWTYFHFSLGKYLRMEEITGYVYVCLKTLPYSFPIWSYHFTLYYQFMRVFLILVILVSRKWHLTLDLIWSSLMTDDVGHPFMCLLAIPCLFCEVWILYLLVKCEFKTFLHFLSLVFVFLSLSSLYI